MNSIYVSDYLDARAQIHTHTAHTQTLRGTHVCAHTYSHARRAFAYMHTGTHTHEIAITYTAYHSYYIPPTPHTTHTIYHSLHIPLIPHTTHITYHSHHTPVT